MLFPFAKSTRSIVENCSDPFSIENQFLTVSSAANFSASVSADAYGFSTNFDVFTIIVVGFTAYVPVISPGAKSTNLNEKPCCTKSSLSLYQTLSLTVYASPLLNT